MKTQLLLKSWTSTRLLGFALAASLVSVSMAQKAIPASVTPVPAASNPGMVGQPDDPQLKQSQSAMIKSWEPAADAEYELGPGDEISIDVPGHTEVAGKHVVGPDGRITIPIAGTIDVNNKTRLAASQEIKEALTPYYTDVNVTVGIDKYGSNHVTVLGNVKNPGIISFDSTPTLLAAISKAGLSANATSKDGIPDTCYIYRGNDQRVEVNLRSLLQSGSAGADMRLKRNDFVFVPPQKSEYVSVMGQVKAPGNVPLSPELTLHEAITQAGGFTDDASHNISVVSAVTGKSITITYKQFMTPGGDKEITLHAGDIIAVPKSGFGKVTGFLTKISPVATMVTLGALL
jgi:polysaccharide export outer membrane protein